MRRQHRFASLAVSVTFLSLGACVSEQDLEEAASSLDAPTTQAESAGSDQQNDHGQPQPAACSEERIPFGEDIMQCCEIGNRSWLTRDGTFLVRRTYGTPCRREDGEGTDCGVGTGVQCAYGPCGVRNDWRLDGANVVIFEPESDPQRCGWHVEDVTRCTDALHPSSTVPTMYDDEMCDDDRWHEKGYQPEPYVVGRPLYGGVTGTCGYNRCQNGEPIFVPPP